MNGRTEPSPRATVAIVTPAARGSRSGNRVTALRYARFVRQLGHRAVVAERLPAGRVDALLAVHARKSAAAVLEFAARGGARATAVLLAGTDVYPRFEPDAATLQCLATAHRILALQREAVRVLPGHLAERVRVVVQSAAALPSHRPAGLLRACVLSHLRAVKDPLLPFAALAHVPPAVRIEIELAGRALDADLGERARRCADQRGHYRGELHRRAALQLLADSHVLVVPSLGEGGANVVSEAIAAGTVPVVSAIPGNTGLLGDDWPAQFAPGDARALATLLVRCADDLGFRALLQARTAALAPMVDPARERAALAAVLADLGIAGPAHS